jgi:cyclopropane-fatty-acyl-phospholipid synthase|tara:strand:+ start:343 stop:1539 length:1197 start_codon:yes stop_codon:yes gene_type:complete
MWSAILITSLETFIVQGNITVKFVDGNIKQIGQRGRASVVISLLEKDLPKKLILNPELALGEAYTNGTLVIENDDLFGLLKILALNAKKQQNHWLSKLVKLRQNAFRRFFQRNKISGAKLNVAHHYDLSPELYEMFLDKDLNYSCAYFLSDKNTLVEAQKNKKHHIAKKLMLKPNINVLDIGCGWGGMSLTLAREYEANVLGITLSKEQKLVCEQRALEEGLSHKVKFELMDYREDVGKFDRIVSIGMFEHVGIPNYNRFWREVFQKLSDDGIGLIHTIGRATPPGGTNPWINKYIFPGGYIPAMSEVMGNVEQNDLYVTDVEVLRLHYAKTLKRWYENFRNNEREIKKIYDEKFCRMWKYYLIASEISFRYYQHVVFQFQISKKIESLPLSRAYIYE